MPQTRNVQREFVFSQHASRRLAGVVGERINPYGIMAVGSALSVILFLLGAFLPHSMRALAACVAAGFTGSCLWPTMLAVAADRYPDGGASMFAALAAFGNAGGIFMPWIVGWIGDQRNLHWGIASSAFAPLLMIPLVLALWAGRIKQFR